MILYRRMCQFKDTLSTPRLNTSSKKHITPGRVQIHRNPFDRFLNSHNGPSQLQTFSVSGARSTVTDVTDGVTMAQVLHQIAPNFFSDTWMSRIKTDVGDNWRLKVINLKKVLKGILDYYSDVLGQQINDFHMPDVSAIGERDDSNELGRLLQLILGCAVNCDSKQEYIKRIMAMEESVQHGVMKAIQELMTKEVPASVEGYSELGDQLKKAVGELNTAVEQKDEIAQRCHELDLQVAALQEERAIIVSENEKLNDRLNQSDFLDDSSTWINLPEYIMSPAGRKHQQLQHQIEQLQEELDRSEGGREDLRIKVELQEKEIVELQQKNEEMTGLAEEAMTLKDEIDILRHTADKVTKYEATMESYKKKIQELSDLKGRIKMLEEKNTAFVQKNLELEEENRKLHLVKSQLDMYKRQIQELQMKTADETKRADKAEFEMKRHQEKMLGLQKEKERLMMERDSLKETNEELRCMQGTQDSLDGEVTMALSGSPGSLDLMAVPPDVREKMIRLQHENKMLKVQQTDMASEQGQLLQTLLDDANARKNELESEVRIANQRVLELEAQIEDMHEDQEAAITTAVATATAAAVPPGGGDDKISKVDDLEKQLAELQDQGSKLQAELEAKTLQLDEKTTKGVDLNTKVTTLKKSVKELKDSLERKDDEMRAMEERYRRYLEKAKNVIKNLDPTKLNAGASPDVFALRNQLQEKTQLIGSLEKDRDVMKRTREQEEKLVVTAWYNLGTQLNRAAMEERLSNSLSSSGGKSFLARQRQAHTRRTPGSVMSPHMTGNVGTR
ncbi:Hook-like protein 3 [Lamellibrachia satsuma]|nr:Hook-like protein 3 [Lamellibrachia satsuma]